VTAADTPDDGANVIESTRAEVVAFCAPKGEGRNYVAVTADMTRQLHAMAVTLDLLHECEADVSKMTVGLVWGNPRVSTFGGAAGRLGAYVDENGVGMARIPKTKAIGYGHITRDGVTIEVQIHDYFSN